ncbi:MAG: hypothetical protein HS115_06140 [Spirochaetales bacterium]|nr:hypothetical protein [Spirochaetales bacterium]
MRILVLGGSYTGRYLAAVHAEKSAIKRALTVREDLRQAFDSISRVCLVTRSIDAYRSLGFDVLEPHEACRSQFDLVLDTVPQASAGSPAYAESIARLMAGKSAPVYVHISTTSVYPANPPALDEGVPCLNEDTPPMPDTDGARNRLQLERLILESYPQARILRSAGLYGPGRALPLMFQAKDFNRLLSGNGVVSRIHVADLLRLAIAMVGANTPSLVNAVDACPSANSKTFAYLEDLLGQTLPGSWRGDMPVGRAMESKYARKMLGDYLYPSYVEGFYDVLEQSRWPGAK